MHTKKYDYMPYVKYAYKKYNFIVEYAVYKIIENLYLTGKK